VTVIVPQALGKGGGGAEGDRLTPSEGWDFGGEGGRERKRRERGERKREHREGRETDRHMYLAGSCHPGYGASPTKPPASAEQTGERKTDVCVCDREGQRERREKEKDKKTRDRTHLASHAIEDVEPLRANHQPRLPVIRLILVQLNEVTWLGSTRQGWGLVLLNMWQKKDRNTKT
jgi:hypothetical protein